MADFNGRTPLHWAAAQGYVDLVHFLVNQEKTNLNAVYGSFFGRLKTKKSADFNNDPVENMTPLHLAVIHNHLEVVAILLKVPSERGLDVNAICKRKVQFENEKTKYIWKWTPFQLAAYLGHERILQVFLKDLIWSKETMMELYQLYIHHVQRRCKLGGYKKWQEKPKKIRTILSLQQMRSQ